MTEPTRAPDARVAVATCFDILVPVTSTLIRRTGLVLTIAALPVLVAAPAVADVPEGWSDPPEVGLLDLLLVVAGVPLLIGALIVLAVYAPALRRGERVAPGAGHSDHWFGGPRQGTEAIEAAEQPASRREPSVTGGASGTW